MSLIEMCSEFCRCTQLWICWIVVNEVQQHSFTKRSKLRTQEPPLLRAHNLLFIRVLLPVTMEDVIEIDSLSDNHSPERVQTADTRLRDVPIQAAEAGPRRVVVALHNHPIHGDIIRINRSPPSILGACVDSRCEAEKIFGKLRIAEFSTHIDYGNNMVEVKECEMLEIMAAGIPESICLQLPVSLCCTTNWWMTR